MKNRSTIDIVVIILASSIGFVVAVTIVGIIAMRLIRPTVDVSAAGEALMSVVTTILGSLLGFIGGRATGKYEQANGQT